MSAGTWQPGEGQRAWGGGGGGEKEKGGGRGRVG